MTQPIHLVGGDFAIHTITSTHVILAIRLPGDDHPMEGYLVSVPMPDVRSLVAQLQSAAPQPTRD